MTCCHYAIVDGNESAFAVDPSAIAFGPGVLAEAGEHLKALSCRRIALFTDATLAGLEPVAVVLKGLRAAGLDVEVYGEVHVEPTDVSFRKATEFAKAGKFDGYVSVGGGSVIDTCKAALLYATYPAELRTYVNAPVGDGKPVPGALPPHIACPTTCGTGSECTGIAVFDDLQLKVKTGIASRRLRPTLALIDPTCTRTLPAQVVAASGFDVLCHALESYTARPYTARPRPATPAARPMSQGRTRGRVVGRVEALRVAGKYFGRGVRAGSDSVARESLSWAATLAGIAFGNAGVHLPHAMSYAVAGLVRDYRCPGYPQHEPMVPHGISVIVNAPSVFRVTAPTSPDRHIEAAAALGADVADVKSASSADAGAIVSRVVIDLMRAAGVPNGVGGVGYGEGDVESLMRGAIVQKRLVDNAPMPIDETAMRGLFRGALSYW